MVNPFDPKTVLLAKHAQHVVLIHFPIALYLSGTLFDLAARVFRKPNFSSNFSEVARWNFLVRRGNEYSCGANRNHRLAVGLGRPAPERNPPTASDFGLCGDLRIVADGFSPLPAKIAVSRRGTAILATELMVCAIGFADCASWAGF